MSIQKYIYLFLILMISNFSIWSQSIKNIAGGDRLVADTNIVLPPSWAFGVLYGAYTNQQETISRIEEILNHDYPIDAYWIDSWFWSYAEKGRGPKKYIDFIADTISFPERSLMWNFMKDHKIKGGFWVWDCILETGNEKAFNDFESRGYFSNVYTETNTWHNNSISTAMFEEDKTKKNGTLCGNIDFDNQQAVSYFKGQMKHFFDEGADFIKLDRTAGISTCKAMFEMSQEYGKETGGRGFMLSHSFETDNEAYKRYPAKWTDDTRSDWTVEMPLVEFNSWVPKVAFKENIAMFTDTGKQCSKIPFLANDLGGFDMGKTPKPDEELYIRWLQFSTFNPIMQVFSQPENPTANLAWMYSARADSIFREFSHLRLQLFPYIYSYALRSRLDGQHMLGKYPDHVYQYSFGDEMLIAPVYERGATTQEVFLPKGKWVNYWTNEHLSGHAHYVVQAPIHQLPIFVKQGSIIPMRRYASSVEKGDNDTIMLHIYPGADGSFRLLEDDGSNNDYLKGGYASTLIEMTKYSSDFLLKIYPAVGSYMGMKLNRTWELLIHSDNPNLKIELDHQTLKYHFDEKSKIGLVKIPGRALKSMTTIKVVGKNN